MVPVTKVYLPPIAEYNAQVKRAWDNSWITNRGQLVLELEEKLKRYLGINNIIITTNGTLPLQIAIKALDLKGEIITTPFSYVATTSVIVWENCQPVFVDIDDQYLTIDETKIAEKITPQTSAILATHVFGNPCNIDVINKIAREYNLKVIYDAAHCFNVKYNGVSVFAYGDVSTCSFHATKLFHTGEGGAMFCNDAELNHKLFYHHNFGHNGPLEFFGLGVNAKISELQAAMGLSVFPYIDTIIQERKKIVDEYCNKLNKGKFQFLKIRENADWNYSYFPVIFESEKKLLEVVNCLNNANIYPRRYFYPSLNTITYTKGAKMPISESIASRILCLPLYVGLKHEELNNIIKIINKHV